MRSGSYHGACSETKNRRDQAEYRWPQPVVFRLAFAVEAVLRVPKAASSIPYETSPIPVPVPGHLGDTSAPGNVRPFFAFEPSAISASEGG